MNQPEIDELIMGYFTQSLDDHELEKLHDWLIGSEENKTYFLLTQLDWFSAIKAGKEIRFDEDKAFHHFLSRINIQKAETSRPPVQSLNSRSFFLRVAASVALLMFFTAVGYWLGSEQKIKQVNQFTVEVPLGSRTKMFLPDGSLVWLNSGSSLSYGAKFGSDDRKVYLKGEGYFDIKKNTKLPFLVHSSDMDVRVLGTKFNFRDYGDEEEIRVALAEGKIRTNSVGKGEQHLLNPNQQIIYDKKTGKTTVSAVEARYASVWTKGLIFFDEERLPDIAKELERCYNVKIRIADDSLRSYRFYGNFARTEQTINEILDALASTNRLRYKIEGKVITLSLR